MHYSDEIIQIGGAPYSVGSSGGGGLGLGNSRGTSGVGQLQPTSTSSGADSASTACTGGGGGGLQGVVTSGTGGGGGGLGPSTHRSAQPSKQHRPLAGQSESKSIVPHHFVAVSSDLISPVSRCPGLQQLLTAPAHSSGLWLPGAGHSPTSPSAPAPSVPKAPSAAEQRPVEASQSTLNLENNHPCDCRGSYLHMCESLARKLRQVMHEAWQTLTVLSRIICIVDVDIFLILSK